MWKEKLGANGRIYKYKDLTGQVFGPLTVLRRGKDRQTKSRLSMSWVCQCECGSIKEYHVSNLTGGVKALAMGKVFSCGCKSSLPFGVSASKAAYRNYRINAKSRGYEFRITWEEFLDITKNNCHYCGTPPKNKIGATTPTKRGNGYYVYNGMDRMDNDEGYNLNNVVPCCRRCNRAKDVMGREEFLAWVKRIYEYSVLKISNS